VHSWVESPMHRLLMVVINVLMARNVHPRLFVRMHLNGPYEPFSGGLPISMWGSHLSSGGYEKHTTGTTFVLNLWKIYENAILIMFPVRSC
jgi:hypothetical protein